MAADLRVRAAVQAERTPALERPMHLVTQLGSGLLLLPLSAVVLGTLWNRERRLAVFLPVTMAGATLLEGLTKWVVARPRPNLQPYGFPSGHTLAAVVFFGALVCALRTGRQSRGWRWAGTVGSVLVVLAIAYSRLYLDAHWLSDVLGGLTGGGAYLVFGLAAFERWWPRPATPPPSRQKRSAPMIGTQDLLIALVLGLFLFGAKRLPELAGAVGKSMREFRKSATTEADPPLPPSAPAGPAACASCQARLAPDWTHCPRCGTPVGGGPPPGAGPHPPATG